MDATRFVRLPRVGWMRPMLSVLLCVSAVAAPTDLFEEYGDGGRYFEEIEIGDMLVYFHQRMIGAATVEKDYIVYQLDKDTGELLARKSHWRDDLPAILPSARISREQAEALVAGEIQFSDLYIISPESDVFPLNPTPQNPCWAVRSVREHGEYVVTIIDAVSGVVLGSGVPPPYTAFSLTGPQSEDPCDGAWTSWSLNAEWWFNTMGYSTEVVEWPTKAKIQSHIQSNETAMFYELAHSGGVSTQFASGCVGGFYEFTYATDIETWMVGYEKMPFAFIGSCFGLCSTGDGTLAYEFRKGSDEDATVVGYCGMSEPQCGDCWTYSIDWQDALFYYVSLGYAVKDACDQADADYPACASGDCMRFVGDEDFAVVPPVPRIPCLKFDYPNGLPELVSPAGGTTVRVEVSSGGEYTPQPGTGQFHYDIGDGFVTVDMQEVSENVYDAVFPAVDCLTVVSYAFSAEATSGQRFYDPPSVDELPPNPYTVAAGYGMMLVFDDPLDADPGWSTEGQWAWGQPTGGGGEHGGPDPTGGHTGSNVYGYNLYGDYPNNMPEYDLTSTAIDCTGLGGLQLSFWRWLGVEQPPYDHAYVRVSDNGYDWTTVWENGVEIADSSWIYQEFDISAVADDQPTVYLRWTMGTTDHGWRYCGWNIDDVQLSAIDCAPRCVGDLDGDGDTDQADLGILLASYGNDAGGDLDGDNDTDQADLGILLADWGCGASP